MRMHLCNYNQIRPATVSVGSAAVESGNTVASRQNNQQQSGNKMPQADSGRNSHAAGDSKFQGGHFHNAKNTEGLGSRMLTAVKGYRPWKWPGFNFITQFFDYTPDEKDTFRLLNFFGLVGALVLTLALAVLTEMDADDIQAADDKYTTPGTGYYDYWHARRPGSADTIENHSPPSKVLAFYAGISLVMLLMEVVLVLVLAVSLTTVLHDVSKARLLGTPTPSSDKGDSKQDDQQRVASQKPNVNNSLARGGSTSTEDNSSKKQAAATSSGPDGHDSSKSDDPVLRIFKAWYKYNRLVLLAAVLLLVVGVYMFFLAAYYLVLMKYPDYVVRDTSRKQYTSVYGFTEAFLWAVLLFFIAGVTVSGMGTRAAHFQYKEECPKDDEREQKNDTDEQKNDKQSVPDTDGAHVLQVVA